MKAFVLVAVMFLSLVTQGQGNNFSNYIKAGIELKERLDNDLVRKTNFIKQEWFQQVKTGKLNFWFMKNLKSTIDDYTDAYRSAGKELGFYKMKPAITDDTTAAIIKANELYFETSILSNKDDSVKMIAVSMIGKDIKVTDVSNWFTGILLIIILITAAIYSSLGKKRARLIPFAVMLIAFYTWIHLSWPYASFNFELILVSLITGLIIVVFQDF
jgi:hypothetical protein